MNIQTPDIPLPILQAAVAAGVISTLGSLAAARVKKGTHAWWGLPLAFALALGTALVIARGWPKLSFKSSGDWLPLAIPAGLAGAIAIGLLPAKGRVIRWSIGLLITAAVMLGLTVLLSKHRVQAWSSQETLLWLVLPAAIGTLAWASLTSIRLRPGGWIGTPVILAAMAGASIPAFDHAGATPGAFLAPSLVAVAAGWVFTASRHSPWPTAVVSLVPLTLLAALWLLGLHLAYLEPRAALLLASAPLPGVTVLLIPVKKLESRRRWVMAAGVALSALTAAGGAWVSMN